jgi:16S rRNA (uracil1498-N3)-methyltransferase
MRCFFCKNLNDDYAVLSRAEERHLFKVLRTESGKEILLINGSGTLAEGIICTDKRVKITVRHVYDNPAIRIHLFTALPRKHRMDTLLAQCTEAGLWALHPIVSERSVVIPRKDNMNEKWNEKIVEACKQAHNPFIPEIYSPVKLNEALTYIKDKNISAYYGSTKSNDDSLDNSANTESKDIAWIVGPEGGFSKDEIQLLEENKVKGISLGKWVMRIETAALAGVLLLQKLSRNQICPPTN